MKLLLLLASLSHASIDPTPAAQSGQWIFVVSGTTFTSGNAGYVQFPSAQAVTLPVNGSTWSVVGLNGQLIQMSVNGTTFTATNPGVVAGTVAVTNISNQTLVVQSSATTLVASTVAVVNPLGMTMTTQSTWTVVQGTVNVTNVPNGTLNIVSSYTIVISTKIVTFTYASTTTMADTVPIIPSTGMSVFNVLNGGSSTHVLRIRRISATTHMGKSIGTGANANKGIVQLGVVPFSAITVAGGTSQIVNRKMDTTDGALDAQVTISTGGGQTFTSDTPLFSSLVALATQTFFNDRPDVLYEESMTAGKPLTLRAGEGFAVIRSSQPGYSAIGSIRTTVIFTQE